jgi:hypothetical protein
MAHTASTASDVWIATWIRLHSPIAGSSGRWTERSRDVRRGPASATARCAAAQSTVVGGVTMARLATNLPHGSAADCLGTSSKIAFDLVGRAASE